MLNEPIEERAPDGFRLLLREPVENHRHLQHVARPQDDLLAPMRIEQRLAVEANDPGNQPAEGSLRCCLDGHIDGAEERRQFMRAQREPGDDTEAAATAPLETPEQVRIGASIGDPHRPVSGDDLGLQETRRS